LAKNSPLEMSKQHIICKSEALVEKGKGVRFSLPELGEGLSAFVVRFQNKPYAYINQCAHLPIELDCNEGEFFTKEQDFLICATHGAHYEPQSGLCILGPCQGKRLRPIEVNEHNGVISITLDKI
jgi:nitrite reductase/ring-hydroxylating ferredoxin subunit